MHMTVCGGCCEAGTSVGVTPVLRILLEDFGKISKCMYGAAILIFHVSRVGKSLLWMTCCAWKANAE